MASPRLPDVRELFGLSDTSLRSVVLGCRARASDHLKIAKNEWQQAALQEATALCTEYVLEFRDALVEEARRTIEAETAEEFPQIRKSA